MKTTSESMTKIDHNSELFLSDCGYISKNIKERDRHILETHKHTPDLVEQIVGVELWENWRKVLREEV